MQYLKINDLENLQDKINQQFSIKGKVVDVSHLLTRTGKKWGEFSIIDSTGNWGFALFGKEYELLSPKLVKDRTVQISIKIQKREWGNLDELDIRIIDIN